MKKGGSSSSAEVSQALDSLAAARALAMGARRTAPDRAKPHQNEPLERTSSPRSPAGGFFILSRKGSPCKRPRSLSETRVKGCWQSG